MVNIVRYSAVRGLVHLNVGTIYIAHRCTHQCNRLVVGYIKSYNKIYKKVLKEAKQRDNDRYVTRASNKTKAMWQLINKKIGRTKEDDNKLELKLGNNLITNPKEITEILNEYFTNITTDLIKPSIGHNNNLSQKINTCATSVFIYPVMEEEVVNMAKTLKNKQNAGPDDIPEYLVKQCIGLIKNH